MHERLQVTFTSYDNVRLTLCAHSVFSTQDLAEGVEVQVVLLAVSNLCRLAFYVFISASLSEVISYRESSTLYNQLTGLASTFVYTQPFFFQKYNYMYIPVI